MSEEAGEYRPRCKHLYCKAMLVYGESFALDPDYQTGLGEFWCLRTSRGHGPDGDEASLEGCTDPARSCFRAF